MLRESTNHALRWADKTLSLLHERQLEASENRLSFWPEIDLFSESCTEAWVPELWKHSHIGMQTDLPPMFSMKQLRDRVLGSIEKEALFLTLDEIQMLMQLIRANGTIELMNLEESATAELLMRRLWCWPEWLDEERVLLHLAAKPAAKLLQVINSRQMDQVQTILMQVNLRVRSSLYDNGTVDAGDVLLLMQSLLADVVGDLDDMIVHCAMITWMKCSFDYVFTSERRMMLLHPGLAEPEKSIPCPLAFDESKDLMAELFSSVAGIMPNEMPVYESVVKALEDYTRPELTSQEAAQDLLILAKQAIPLRAMIEALSTMIFVLPTDRMLHIMYELSTKVQPWPCFRPTVIN